MTTPTQPTPASPAAKAAEEIRKTLNNSWGELIEPMQNPDITAIIQKLLDEQMKDTARLDWLVSHSAYVAHSKDGELCWVMIPSNEDGEGHVSATPCGYWTADEAIDQARHLSA